MKSDRVKGTEKQWSQERLKKKVSSGKVLNIHSQQHNSVAKKNAESYPKITLKVIEKQNFKGLTNSS